VVDWTKSTEINTVIRPVAGVIGLAEQREVVMSLLEQAVAAVGEWGPQRSDDRKQCIALLQQLTENLGAAIKIWEELHQEAPVSRNTFTVLLSIGAERSKTLYSIYQDQKDAAGELSALTGIPLRDTLGLSD
jgi:hypothetical protein